MKPVRPLQGFSLALVVVCALVVPALPASPLPPPRAASAPRSETIASSEYAAAVEQDWLRQAKFRQQGGTAVTTESDARGGCDGVKDGKYAFHTGQEPNPWWQVDLGSAQPVHRLKVWNRLDYAPGLHNADRLRVLTSTDGKQWSACYENPGKHFGGISGAPPLEVTLTNPVQARFVRLQIPSDAPIFFHLDEVEVYGSADTNGFARNLALHCPASQSSLSPWSTFKPLRLPDAERTFPVPDVIRNARNLARVLQASGIDLSAALSKLAQLEKRHAAQPRTTSEADRQALYLEARRAAREIVLSHPLLDFDRLLFVKRFTQETYPDVCLNHMPWVSRPGGDLCILAAPKGHTLRQALLRGGSADAPLTLTSVLNQALGPGHVHGMDLHWSGTRIVFGYARKPSQAPPEGWLDRAQSYRLRRTVEPTHLYEIGTDGQNLRQLTTGEWSDLDPTYAPNDDIVFVSERCGTSLQCNEYDKDETSCNLYVMKPDGTGIRRLSVNKDGDYLPHTLDDGSIAYTRWEYHERSWAFIQSIWTVRPDGTGADAIFKQHFVDPWALEDTRSIPGSRKLVAIAAGHHTLAVGPVVVVDPSLGINNPKGMSIVTPDVKPTEGGMDGVPVPEGGTRDGGGLYSTPWALSEKSFLAAYTYAPKETDATGYALYLIDVFGNKELLYRDPAISCFLPTPLRPRVRPPILPELVDLAKTNATCLISDVSFGSEEMAGRIRYVRIAEPIGWPYDNELGGQRYGEKGPQLVNWTPIRILGDVPVEPDGSVRFEVPADVAVYFQLLDEHRMELRRMRSFISFQPGEQRACAGCHETRGVVPRSGVAPLAGTRPSPSLLLPPWGDRPVSFLRDIQPILDTRCTECHSGLRPAAGLDFSGGLTDWSRQFEAAWGLVPGYGFNRAFETITQARLVQVADPNRQDASITPALAYGAHASKLWKTIESPFHREKVRLTDTERLTLTMWMDANAPYHDRFVNKRGSYRPYDIATDTGLVREITAVHERRCASCHQPAEVTRLDWINLFQPERTLFLRAPLKKSAGGTQTCPGAVYAGSDDPDYRKLRELVGSAARKAIESPRRDLHAVAR